MKNCIKNFFKDVWQTIPGVLVALAIAAVAKTIEYFLPIHVIGASVLALFIGIILNTIRKPDKVFAKGLKFTSKKLLKFAIILLGFSLNIKTILVVGRMSLTVMVFTLFTCFGIGYFVGRALKLNWKTSNLISAGTGICGGSAIAAIAPVIDADDTDIALGMSATFLFDMVMILVFPLLGKWMGLSDEAYGLWAGTAVNDTSSVVAAGYAFSDAAGDFACMVKLTRTLAIIPTVIIFSIINIHLKRKEAKKQLSEATVNEDGTTTAVDPSTIKNNLNIWKVIPWFIVVFVLIAILNSFVTIPAQVGSISKEVSKFLMVAALAAIGLNTDIKDMKKAGIRPMLHGFIVSLLVVLVALAVEYFMGLI